jgi:IS5 family transposase
MLREEVRRRTHGFGAIRARNFGMSLPASPFSPVALLFTSVVDSNLLTFLEEAHEFIVRFPELVDLVESDLDEHARKKKALRVADAKWEKRRSLSLSGLAPEPIVVNAKELKLEHGRPRTPGYVVLVAMLLRGYFGAGFKACETMTMLQESTTLRVVFANLGMKLPGGSTLTELVNAVTNATRLRLLDAQVAHALHLKLDDFTTMLQDSTHVAGNTEWPTDSRLMVNLVRRVLRVGATLGRVQLPVVESVEVQKVLASMVTLDREIDMSRGKKEGARERRRRYERLLKKANRVHELLSAKVTPLGGKLAGLDVRPSHKALATRAVGRLQTDLDALTTVIANCEARVLRDEKVPMSEKILSLSDPDAGFIAKGQREAVIGYKPQVARSGAGFITGLLLPKGNAPDSKQLVSMVDDVIARTHVTPKVLSVDDGYASGNNVTNLKTRGIEIISINGSKGRALTAQADWNSDEYADARDLRSAVESLMFTLKQGFDFGEVARRGLSAAHAELLEKALAYNLCHMARLRKAAAAKAKEADRPMRTIA